MTQLSVVSHPSCEQGFSYAQLPPHGTSAQMAFRSSLSSVSMAHLCISCALYPPSLFSPTARRIQSIKNRCGEFRKADRCIRARESDAAAFEILGIASRDRCAFYLSADSLLRCEWETVPPLSSVYVFAAIIQTMTTADGRVCVYQKCLGAPCTNTAGFDYIPSNRTWGVTVRCVRCVPRAAGGENHLWGGGRHENKPQVFGTDVL